MPTTTWEIANREIQRPLGFEAFSTTTNIATNNVVISTELGNRWNQDDSFNGWFVMIRGTSNNNEVVRRVTDYAGSTGTLTIAGAALGNTESGATTCEVSRFHPDDVKRAYNRSRQDVFPALASHKDHRGIVTDRETLAYPVPTAMRRVDRVMLGQAILASHSDNLFTDGGFEDWTNATTLANWTFSGSGSVNQEEATGGPLNHMVLTDSNSAHLHVTSASTLLQTVSPSVAIEGVYVVMAIYAYSRTASALRCQIASDNGSYHGGTGWEVITHSFKLSDSASNFTAGVQVNSSSEAYLDRAVVWAGPPSAPEGLWEPVENWNYIPPLDGASDGGQIFLSARPRNHEVLRLIGRGMLSSVSADSDTIEIDGELLAPVYDKVRSMLAWEQAGGDPGSDWATRAREFDLAYRQGINGSAVIKARPSLSVTRRAF